MPGIVVAEFLLTDSLGAAGINGLSLSGAILAFDSHFLLIPLKGHLVGILQGMKVSVDVLIHNLVAVAIRHGGLFDSGVMGLETLGTDQGVVNGMDLIVVIIGGIGLQFCFGGTVAQAIGHAALLGEAGLPAPRLNGDFLYCLVVQHGIQDHLIDHVGTPHELGIGVFVILVVGIHKAQVGGIVVDGLLGIGLAAFALIAVGEISTNTHIQGGQQGAIALTYGGAAVFIGDLVTLPQDLVFQRQRGDGMITQGPDRFTIVPQAAVSAEGHTGERTAVGAVSNLSVLLQLSNLASGELDLIIVQDLISTAISAQGVGKDLIAQVKVDHAVIHGQRVDQVGVHIMVSLVLLHLGAERSIIAVLILLVFLTEAAHIAGMLLSGVICGFAVSPKTIVEDNNGLFIIRLAEAAPLVSATRVLSGHVGGADRTGAQLIGISGIILVLQQLTGAHVVEHVIATVVISCDILHRGISTSLCLHIVESAGRPVVDYLAAGLAEPGLLIGIVVIARFLKRVRFAIGTTDRGSALIPLIVVEYLAVIMLGFSGGKSSSILILIVIVYELTILVEIGDTRPFNTVIERI